jgi:8-oxo-dGTP pyrophosphatase MutT (NUDIX family)
MSIDLTLPVGPAGQFTFRVGYLVFRGDEVLLMKSRGGYWFVPGGRVAFGEATPATLVRELYEETGLTADRIELAGLVENFFALDGIQAHELTVFYRAHVAANRVPAHDLGGHAPFGWHRVADLPQLDLRPTFLTTMFDTFRTGFTHHVHHDVRPSAKVAA